MPRARVKHQWKQGDLAQVADHHVPYPTVQLLSPEIPHSWLVADLQLQGRPTRVVSSRRLQRLARPLTQMFVPAVAWTCAYCGEHNPQDATPGGPVRELQCAGCKKRQIGVLTDAAERALVPLLKVNNLGIEL